jgi:hypothetical protein
LALTVGSTFATIAIGVFAGSPAHAAPVSAGVASFTWQLAHLQSYPMPDWGSQSTNESTTSPVTLNACSSSAPGGIASYQWTFGNGDLPIATPSCVTTWQRPVSHNGQSVAVTLTAFSSSGATLSVTQKVQFRDVVIASLGDSIAAGQGAPDSGQSFSINTLCHRSTLAAGAKAAVRIQQSLGANVTVHFWFLACSGASIPAGMLQPYNEPESQLSRLNELITQSGLTVDRLLISIGANDVPWAQMLGDCLLPAGLDPTGLAQAICTNQHAPGIAIGIGGLVGYFQALRAQLATMPRNHAGLTRPCIPHGVSRSDRLAFPPTTDLFRRADRSGLFA